MKFFETVRASVYDPEFYVERAKDGAKGGLKYFAALLFFLSVVMAGVAYGRGLVWYSQNKSEVGNLKDRIVELYPSELKLTFSSSKIVSNVKEPYFIVMPKGVKAPGGHVSKDTPTRKNFVVINTAKSVETSDFDTYDTYVVVGSDAIGMLNESRNKVEIQRVGDFTGPGFTLDRALVDNVLSKGFVVLKVVLVIGLLFLPIFLFAGNFIANVLYLLIGALVVWIVTTLRGYKFGYQLSYKLGLYLITLPILFDLLTSVWLFPQYRFPFFFTFVLAVMVWINFPKFRVVETVNVSNSPNTSIVEAPAAEIAAPAVPKDLMGQASEK